MFGFLKHVWATGDRHDAFQRYYLCCWWHVSMIHSAEVDGTCFGYVMSSLQAVASSSSALAWQPYVVHKQQLSGTV